MEFSQNTSPKFFIFLTLLLIGGLQQVRSQETEDLMDMSLEELLEMEVSGRGEVGSYGSRFGTESTVSIHGYASNEYFNYEKEGKISTFDQHYFNLFFTITPQDKIVGEIQLEYEHGGDEIQIRYAQMDYELSESLILRTGKFLIPSGIFNEYLYPDYILKTISKPYINREISPSAWAEVGVQIRGKLKLGSFNPYYALFAVNGLEGDEGSGIRGMRGNHRDKKNDNKALGGKVGLVSGHFEGGASVYNGKYTEDGKLNLIITGIDLSYATERFTFRGEYQMADQEIMGGSLKKSGLYALGSVILHERFEPVLMFDKITLDGEPEDDRQRVTVGLNYHASNELKFKINYEMVSDAGTDVDDNIIGLQAALGF